MPSDNQHKTIPLYRLAHSRSGDKGDISNISVIALRPECFPLLKTQLTELAVSDWFAFRHPVRIQRHVIESIQALNFVLHGVLDGGVNDALNLDTHGKALSFHLLDYPVMLDGTPEANLVDPT
ncbi:hypothetical protein LKR43_04905 [Pusillimonas sp. MFBS29]|uniref:AtuA-related protein n=1 Tax=Pusillimonas sp. MFBS29 TaxID=2886690 RepID=UPI001D128C50|nr:hypothetical protein [Pusillimonas sp. MFBS29]MCC2595676.1 hypothetical protein [Pusillimonas sp. MFBS29]